MVMRTIFGFEAARVETADEAIKATRSAGKILRNMESSLSQGSHRRTHAGGGARAAQARVTSTIMEARITA
jgi:hypothetical protein